MPQRSQPRHGVAVAIRRDDGKYLMVRRSRHVRSPLAVCFPGGMVEEGETQEQAVIREMIEELGLRVTPIRAVWRYHWPERNLLLFGWEATLDPGQQLRPDESEIAEVLWLSPEEGCAHPDALPTNRDFIQCLCGDLSHNAPAPEM
jgi:8-oxo-dGTP pyrophosphatase MutT (NUDIX family)